MKAEVSKFYKEISSWLSLYDDLNDQLKVAKTYSINLHIFLKEMGDVVNWSKIIERDLLNVVESMEKMRKSKKI